jgi:Ca2+-binding EF-hand superfamily protein
MKRIAGGLLTTVLFILFVGATRAQDNPGPKTNRPARGTGGAPDLDAIFTRFDTNGDGVLTRDEFPRPERFDALDADKDGKITREELRNGIAGGLKKPGDRAGQQMLAARLKQLDTDGDGRISKAEFEAAFARLDKNGDGYLTEDELKAAFGEAREKKENKRTESAPTEPPKKE